ncbi:MAG: DNA polymerase I, partial [Oscillospiraceae bacterium]|nr:DNA polymerase I [Oscillospiraceae bacterium]
AHYSGVRRYMKEAVEKAKANGYAVTVFGRRRDMPELTSSNRNMRAFGERVALNMPVQGTAADIMKIAMIKAAARIKAENLRARIILQVHDELIAECPPEEEERVKKLLSEEMEGAVKLSVPLTAEAHSGLNWYDAK